MGTGRLEAFSDGVIAIIITIMVLELKVPHEATFAAMRPMVPVLCSYVASFVFVGIYWNNHHHMLHLTKGVSGGILWANLHLLFWLSLVPWVTGWLGDHHAEVAPTVAYGAVLLMAAIAFTLLQMAIVRNEGAESLLAKGIGADWKGKASLLLYAVGIGAAFASWMLADACYAAVALIWLVPDTRLERVARDG